MNNEDINIIDALPEEETLPEEEKYYGKISHPCPRCYGMTLTEDTFGYEKTISCSHCEYFVSKTI